MLCKALKNYGNVKHIHSPVPPNSLEYIGYEKGGKVQNNEWFNGIKIPAKEASNYTVIYIYRNPCYAIPSRFLNKNHQTNIGLSSYITLDDVLKSGKDLYKVTDFYNSYTRANSKRKYKIYAIKYEDIFEKQRELSERLGIGPLNMSNLSKRKEGNKDLEVVYRQLIQTMENNEFIMEV
jgi:hypothetical protein